MTGDGATGDGSDADASDEVGADEPVGGDRGSTEFDAIEHLHATGHEHVRAEHESTLEVTTDDYLTPAGDCIVGIEADRAPADFDDAFVEACRDDSVRIVATLTVGEREARVVGRGDPRLTFESERGAVLRTSDYVDERTVLVGADAAAADLDRDLVAALAEGAELEVELAVEASAGGGS